VNAVVLTCGVEVFDARNREEYGYGVYPNVVNAIEMEAMLDPMGLQKVNYCGHQIGICGKGGSTTVVAHRSDAFY
jgi:heterodisulfide reductase subunit A-like polyferredoxin